MSSGEGTEPDTHLGASLQQVSELHLTRENLKCPALSSAKAAHLHPQ